MRIREGGTREEERFIVTLYAEMAVSTMETGGAGAAVCCTVSGEKRGAKSKQRIIPCFSSGWN
jgi:hypothetical protein